MSREEEEVTRGWRWRCRREGGWDCGSIKFITLTADKYLCDAQNTCDNRLLKWQCGQLFKCFAAICQRDDKDDKQGKSGLGEVGAEDDEDICLLCVRAYWMTNGSNDPMQCKTLRFISSTRELVNVGSRARWWQDRMTKTEQNRKRTTARTWTSNSREEVGEGEGGKTRRSQNSFQRNSYENSWASWLRVCLYANWSKLLLIELRHII